MTRYSFYKAPRMSRGHFKLLACMLSELRAALPPRDRIVIDCTAGRFADTFAEANPGFKRDKFLKAAGVPEDVYLPEASPLVEFINKGDQ